MKGSGMKQVTFNHPEWEALSQAGINATVKIYYYLLQLK